MEAIKIGKTITVYTNGRMYKKSFGTEEMADEIYRTVLENKDMSFEQFKSSLLPYFNERTRTAMECGLELDINTGNIYLPGYYTPMPRDLVDIFEEYHAKNYPLEAVRNFWQLLMLNPIPKVREDAFKFIKTHDLVISKNGYLIVYKGVDIFEEEENDLLAFVTNKYLHVKKHWKTNPARYCVYKDGEEYKLTKEDTYAKWEKNADTDLNGYEYVGNLKKLFEDIEYSNLSKEDKENTTIYTDYHTHTFRIKVGEPVRQDMAVCDPDPNVSCSYGLHVGATSYVENFVRTNGAVLVCYVNPANIIAVPESDNSKMRVSEYFPFAVATYDGQNIDIIEEEYFESDYADIEAKELEEMLNKIKSDEKPFSVVGEEVTDDVVEDTRPLEELRKIIEDRYVVLQ